MKAFLAAASMILLPIAASADTVYLSNGGAIEGIIERDSADSVELNVGFGTMTVGRNEIKRIERSTAEEHKVLSAKWEEKRKRLQEQEKELVLAREKRFAEYEKYVREEEERLAKESRGAKDVTFARDMISNSILVETLLNEKVKTILILDTGASIMVLPRRVGKELGLDLSDTKKNMVELQAAGSHKIKAKAVLLKDVRIQDIVEHDVMAAVIIDEAEGRNIKDGLLGRSFLNRFNINIDLTTGKMTFERLK